MKAKPYKWSETGKFFEPCEAKEATHVMLNFPGPSGMIRLPVVHGNTTRAGTCCWSWNGDTEKPTLKPSIRTTGADYVCHTWVNDGKAQFLSDCTHSFRNQTVEMLEVDL